MAEWTRQEEVLVDEVQPNQTGVKQIRNARWLYLLNWMPYCYDSCCIFGDNYAELHLLQVSALPHFALPVHAWLGSHFTGRCIGRWRPTEWPSRSSHFTPRGFLFVVWAKEGVYQSKSRVLDELEQQIWNTLFAVPFDFLKKTVGRESVVSVAIRYGLDGPGIELRWGRDFPHPSRPAVGSTQFPVKWVLGLFSGGKAAGAWR